MSNNTKFSVFSRTSTSKNGVHEPAPHCNAELRQKLSDAMDRHIYGKWEEACERQRELMVSQIIHEVFES